MDGDGALTAADFAAMLAPGYEALLAAIARGDDAWLAENYAVRLTCAWFAGHEALAPNREVLPTLDIPIHILHGVSDANAPVEGVYEIEAAFAALGKTNLDARTYPRPRSRPQLPAIPVHGRTLAGLCRAAYAADRLKTQVKNTALRKGFAICSSAVHRQAVQ